MKIELREAALAVLALAAAAATGCAGSAGPVTWPSESATPADRARPGASQPHRPSTDPAVASVPVPSGSAPTATYHTVLPGETLTSIARSHGVTVAALIDANGIADPDRVAAGAQLIVPGSMSDTGVWIWPVRGGALLAPFGEPRGGRSHRGIDIRGRSGQEVLAAREGRVAFAGTGLGGYGKTVILNHGDGFESLYAHNSDLLVREGDIVRQGHPIARVGRSGNATTEHCHFEIRREQSAIDPLPHVRVFEAHR